MKRHCALVLFLASMQVAVAQADDVVVAAGSPAAMQAPSSGWVGYHRARPVRPEPVPEGGDGLGIFTQPVGVLLMAADTTAYVPLGVEIPLSAQLDLIVQVSGSAGGWYQWDSTSRGGWASVSVPWFVVQRGQLTRGWFIAPGLTARYLSTHLDHTSKGLDEGRVEFVDNIPGEDYELHAGVDLGYNMRIGMLELAAPVLGVSAGYCGNCVTGSVFFFGPMSRFFSWVPDPVPRRKNRFTLALNLNIVRVGARF